mmetsp:Transcript_24696/g.50679  ORF Transcript_24696/g.50679 Transcript_24696/m.50679 type:complete len:172 (-) Transcript_24696:275-790(-)
MNMSTRQQDIETDDESEERKEQEAKVEAVKPEPFSGDVVDLVARKLLEDSEFTRSIDEWLESKVAALDSEILFTPGDDKNENAGSKEHSLEHSTLHTEFTALFEEKIEQFIASKGLTTVDFFNEIRDSQESSAQQSSKALVGEIMLATFDFDVFMALVREIKSNQNARRHK